MNERTIWFESDFNCKPLKTLKEIQLFVFDPPAWRTLCQPLTPHSGYVIKNSEVDPQFEDVTLEEPLTFCHFDPDRIDVVTRHEGRQLPKLLVCHDMANGYHDDSYIDGTSQYDTYTFYNWAAVDIFCYFSHHLITIPPLSWINVAHAHGVKVIGTFITEWAEGVSFWNKIFAEEVQAENLVSWLVTIAKTLKFEGWLINVENKIAEPEKLLKFVDHLHKTLHQEIPDAELIWYDSVTKTGQLSWQNRLNDLNRPFFDACDGIFTNYSWTEVDIEESVKAAGSRIRDLYIGIDVWGRNFYGGGMFNTHQAVKLVHKHKCSMAVFAPAWTHEAMGEQNSYDPNAVLMAEDLSRYERFLIRDRALWGSLWPYLKTRLPCNLPFKTSFCRGNGLKRRMCGEVLCNGPWYNLRHMQYQPNSAHGPHGYLLSTDDRMKALSHITTGENKGILKLRQSLFQLNIISKEEQEEKYVAMQEYPNINEKISDKDTNNIDEDKKMIDKDTNAIDEDKKMIDRDTNTIDEDKKMIDKDTNTIDEDKKMIDKDTNTSQDDDSNKKKFLSHKDSASVLEDESKTAKLKNVFRKLLSRKNDKKKVDSRSTQEGSELNKCGSALQLHTPERSMSLIMSSGRSMLQAPIQFNLRQTRFRYTVGYVSEERECLKVCLDDSFNGGCCLKINPSDHIKEEHRTIRLFQSDFSVEGTLVICMVTKIVTGFSGQWLNMWLYMMTDRGTEERVELVGRSLRQNDRVSRPSPWVEQQFPLDPASDKFRELQTYLVVNEPGFYVPIENSYGWQIFYYQLSLPKTRVTSVNLRTNYSEGAVLMGHVGFCVRNPHTTT